jgi:4-amino-4-deoxy-L-arabinose transferase-like glycosyltransferase
MNKTSTINYSYLAIFVAIVTSFLYLKTLAPTVIWGDSAKLSTFVYEFDLSIRQGHHPLHTIIGLLFSYLPFGDYAYRQNLMSAFFGALAIAIVYLILLRWTHSVIAAIGGALSLAVSHVFWLLSVINESYTLFAFLMVLMVWLATVWDEKRPYKLLYFTAFVFGMSISNNYLMPFLFPSFVYFYLSAKDRPRLGKWQWLLLSLAFLVGASLTVTLVVKSLISGGHDLLDLFQGGPFRRFYRSPLKILHEILRFPAYLIYQFPLIGFVAGIIGAWHHFRSERRQFTFLFILFLADLIFASGYMRQKQFFLLIGSFIIFALWIGMGIQAFSLWAENRLRRPKIAEISAAAFLVLVPIVFYYSVPTVTKKLDLDLVRARTLPYRDNSRFFLVPDKHNEYGAERFGREVFQILEPNSIIICDFTPIAVLRYFQRVEGIRKDVWLKLVDFKPLETEFVDRQINHKHIYLADDLEGDYSVVALKSKYDLVPVGPIIKLKPKEQKLVSK